jgi:hypothetical protein
VSNVLAFDFEAEDCTILAKHDVSWAASSTGATFFRTTKFTDRHKSFEVSWFVPKYLWAPYEFLSVPTPQ